MPSPSERPSSRPNRNEDDLSPDLVSDRTEREARRDARRARRARSAGKAGKSTSPTPSASNTPSPKPAAKGTPGARKPAKGKQTRKTPRGLVCRACGKYHDVTDREEETTFECYCGRTLEVPSRSERSEQSSPGNGLKTLKIRELESGSRRAAIGATVAFIVSIILISAVIYLSVMRQLVMESVCAAVLALGFLIAAGIASSETRRLKAELAAERVGTHPGA